MSFVLPDLKHPEIVWPTFAEGIAAAIVAAFALSVSERAPNEEAKKGKRARFGKRAINAILLGYTAFNVLEKVL